MNKLNLTDDSFTNTGFLILSLILSILFILAVIGFISEKSQKKQ